MDFTALYCDVDDFFKNYQKISSPSKNTYLSNKRKYKKRKGKLSCSEVMTICIAYHQSGYKNFKTFYLNHLMKYHYHLFPNLVSYNRFIELMRGIIELLALYLESRFEKATGISYIDSTPIQVCKPKRMMRNKVFKNVAKKGKSTIGWFFGFKVHIIINECGGLLAAKFTQANVDDRSPVLGMVKNIFGKLYGDKGYISKKLTENLLESGINLITGIKKNMKNKLYTLVDKILLRKRPIVETVNDQLKNISNIEHSRHRSQNNFIVNLLSGLIAYTHQAKKPKISGVSRTILALI